MTTAATTEMAAPNGVRYACPAEWAADALSYLDAIIFRAHVDGDAFEAEAAAEWAAAWAHLVAIHGGSEKAALADLADFGLPELEVIVWHRRRGWTRTRIAVAA